MSQPTPSIQTSKQQMDEDQLSGDYPQPAVLTNPSETINPSKTIGVPSTYSVSRTIAVPSSVAASNPPSLYQPAASRQHVVVPEDGDDGESFRGYQSTVRPSGPAQTILNMSELQIMSQGNGSEDDLSDEEEQIKEYGESLFPGMIPNLTKSKVVDPKLKNSPIQMSLASDSIKESHNSNNGIRRRRMKSEKREKMLTEAEVSSLNFSTAKSTTSSQEKDMINSKKFSKRHLQQICRKFEYYYAYEMNDEDKEPKITLRDIGEEHEMGHATIHRLYTDWMDDPYFFERINRFDKYRKQNKNPERRLNLDRMQFVDRFIKENPFMTIHELCVELNKNEDLKIIKNGRKQPLSANVVGKLLRMGKFRKKRVKMVPKEKNTSKSLEKRYDYCLRYKAIHERRAIIYYLDESGFNLYMTRDKAWSRPNEEVTVNCPISKGKRFSLIAVIGIDGVAHWRFIEGNYRKFQYLDFIRELFVKLQEKAKLDGEEEIERWIVMDNCAIHDKEQTINLAKQHGINILYLPSYSPQLNPIENWFHEIKCKLKKINYSGENQLFAIMEKILGKYEEHDFGNYYEGSLKYVAKGIRKEKF